MSADVPRLSIIIPMRNAAATIGECLTALFAQQDGDEIIVVDDASTDDSAVVALRFPVRYIGLPVHEGVAAARNAGGRIAAAPTLLFLDADVVPAPDLLAQGLALMRDTTIDALVGSYDDAPAAPSTVSQFKNLTHHYFHQKAAGDMTSFWGACGFIRRPLFLESGGFDAAAFMLPSVEDVAFGMRLVAERHARIRMAPQLQVKHLKRWTLWDLIVTDVCRRAIPWTRFSLAHGGLPRTLNASASQRVAAVGAVILIGSLAWTIRWSGAWFVVLALTAIALALNWGLYRLFWRRGRFRLAAAGFVLQQVYYIYALVGFAVGAAFHFAGVRLGHATVPPG